MPSITLFQTPPPESFHSQIQQLVIDNLTAISAVALPASNALYPLYQYGVGFEVHQYLKAMDGSLGFPVEVVAGLDDEDPSQLLGFALYLPLTGDPQACSLLYLAVKDSHRRQGIAKAMVQKMLSRYPHAELGCVVSQVACGQALGFQVVGTRGSQVLMNTRDHQSEGLKPVLDTDAIYRTVEVRQIHAYLLKQHGEKAMVNAEKQRDRHLDQLAREAQAFVKVHLGL
ncbi:GNAT family N-acetyltransferase [Pseudomonas sp. TE3610]